MLCHKKHILAILGISTTATMFLWGENFATHKSWWLQTKAIYGSVQGMGAEKLDKPFPTKKVHWYQPFFRCKGAQGPEKTPTSASCRGVRKWVIL